MTELMFIKRLLLTLLLFHVLISVHGQYFSVSAGVGASDYRGDVKHDNFNFREWGSSYSLSLSYHITSSWNVEMGLSQVGIMGDDASASTESKRQRNIDFRNAITELSIQVKWNIIPEARLQTYREARAHLSPYVFTGLAAFRHNPKAQFEGDWYALQRLGTEGQFLPNSRLKPYSLGQMGIPMGAGIYYRRGEFLLKIEGNYRWTFSDYLDDVSSIYPDHRALLEMGGRAAAGLSRRTELYSEAGDKRGNPASKDAYFSLILGLGYILK